MYRRRKVKYATSSSGASVSTGLTRQKPRVTTCMTLRGKVMLDRERKTSPSVNGQKENLFGFLGKPTACTGLFWRDGLTTFHASTFRSPCKTRTSPAIGPRSRQM